MNQFNVMFEERGDTENKGEPQKFKNRGELSEIKDGVNEDKKLPVEAGPDE